MAAFFWDCSGYFYCGLGNNRIHGISIYKRTLIHSENGILMAEVTWELLRLPTGSQATGAGGRFGLISRQKLPKRTRILRIPSKPYSVHSVHSAIGSRTESYSVHSENGIAPRRTWIPSIPSNPIPELSQKNAPYMSSFTGFQEWKRLFNQLNLMYLGLFLSVHLRTCSTLILLTALLSRNLTYWCSRWVFIAGKGAVCCYCCCCCCCCYCCCWLSTFYIAPVTTKNKSNRDLSFGWLVTLCSYTVFVCLVYFWDSYDIPDNFFWTQRMSVRVYEDDPTIFEDFRKLHRTFRRIPKFWSFTMRLGSTRKMKKILDFFSFKIGEPGIKAWFTLDYSFLELHLVYIFLW